MSDHSYDILPTRGRWLLSYSDDKDKDKRNSENNVLTYMYTYIQAYIIRVRQKQSALKQSSVRPRPSQKMPMAVSREPRGIIDPLMSKQPENKF